MHTAPRSRHRRFRRARRARPGQGIGRSHGCDRTPRRECMPHCQPRDCGRAAINASVAPSRHSPR
jgi:hypothetical protein